MWDEDGQDLIEYALLTALIAIAGILGFQAIGVAINASYISWDTANQTLWEPPPPTSGN
jgi:Flp pilus assembly pilin Flp